jgi:hypothetical protein
MGGAMELFLKFVPALKLLVFFVSLSISFALMLGGYILLRIPKHLRNKNVAISFPTYYGLWGEKRYKLWQPRYRECSPPSSLVFNKKEKRLETVAPRGRIFFQW